MSLTTDDHSPSGSAGVVPDSLDEAAVVVPKRYHDLDALRGMAMLAGIFLHAMMSFIALPPTIWSVQDARQKSEVYELVLSGLHGFRMPLFFLISGFFTTMMWRKRGAKGLTIHRLKRIGLPLLVGTFTLVPIVFAVMIFFGVNIWSAASGGRIDYVREYVDSGGNVDAVLIAEGFPGHGSTPLHLAVAAKQPEVVELLIDAGASLTAKDFGGNTPLDLAIAAGESDLVEQLRAAGGILGAELPETKPVGPVHSGDFLTPWIQSSPALFQLFALLCYIPMFIHLWFLWYLLWLVAGYLMVATIGKRWGWKPPPARWMTGVRVWLWLIPLTFLPHLFMVQSFGPDTASGPMPWPPKLLCYAVYFGFGAACFGRTDVEASLGRGWMAFLVLGLALLPIGQYLIANRVNDFWMYQSAAAVVESAYGWLMIFGMIGLFRHYFSAQNSRLRYLSDSSYWLYLMHLPLVVMLSSWVSDWPLPSLIKLLFVCATTFAVLLVTYEYCVRYTWIGAILNGRKPRST